VLQNLLQLLRNENSMQSIYQRMVLYCQQMGYILHTRQFWSLIKWVGG